MPPKPHEAAAAPESSHSCCVGKYGNTTVQVMHNARHRPLLQACARRPPVRFPARLFHRVPGPCVQIAKRRGCAWAGGFLWCVCSTGMAQATYAARINTGTHCQQRRVGCHANCERYKADCAQDAKRRAYEKQFAYMDSMPQTATALKKTLAPRRVGGQQ